MAQKPETVFKERAVKDLRKLPNIWFTKIQQVVKRGTPDLILCLNGYFVAIELKATAEDQPSELQKFNLSCIANANGIAIVAHPKNWKQTLELLTAIAQGEEMTLVEVPSAKARNKNKQLN